MHYVKTAKFIVPDWPAPANIKAYTTTRTGWGDPALSAKTPQAREQLHDVIALPSNPVWLNQTHSTLVIPANHSEQDIEADATYTATPNTVCLILTADCLPILICSQNGSHVAAIHAGWRGLANGIIENTLKAMKQPAENLLVWLGPAIGPTKFEVGADVYDAFTSKHATSAAAFKPHANQKWLADLYELARIRLRLAGVTQIYGGQYCTYTQKEIFYSYRRDSGKTGRMASMIWRT